MLLRGEPVLGPGAALSQTLLTGGLFLSDTTGGKRRTREIGLDIGGEPFPGNMSRKFSPP